MISFDDFAKLELKVGTVSEAKEVEGSEKLINLMVDLGEENPRQILAGIKKWYSPASLIGKQFVFVANLEPRMMMGLESNGMLLATDATSYGSAGLRGTSSSKPIPIKPSSKVPAGTKIR